MVGNYNFPSSNFTKGKSFSHCVDYFLRILPIRTEHVHVFFLKSKMFLWSHRIQFGQPCRKFSTQSLKKLYISKLSPKRFLWTSRMQFWQPCRKIFCITSEKFSLKYGKSLNFLLTQYSIFICTNWMQFSQPRRKFFFQSLFFVCDSYCFDSFFAIDIW